MRAALYTRVSTEDQAQGYSLESQLRILRELCVKCEWTIAMEASDDTTGSVLERPGLASIRSAIREKRIDCFLCYDPDRLTRKLAHLMILQDECERYGVRLEFASQPAAKTSEDRLLLNVRGVIAEYEREKIRERTMRGRDEKAKRGLIVGGVAPYGYLYGEPGRLVIDSQTAPTVREIFSRAARGESIRSITRWLNGSEARPMRSSVWQTSTVARILGSDTYAGQCWFFRRRRVNGVVIRGMRAPSEWIPIPSPSIISREMFQAVASRLSANRTALAGRPSATYLLRGLLVCGSCGKRFGGQMAHGDRYYRCNGRCAESQQTEAGRMESTVWRSVSGTFGDPDALRRIVVARLDEMRLKWGEASGAQLEQRIASLRKREENAVKLLLDASYGEHERMLRIQIAQSREQREEAERQRAAMAARSDVLGSVDAACATLQAAMRAGESDQAVKREVLVNIVRRIQVMGKKLDIGCELSISPARYGQFELTVKAEVA